MRILPLSMKDIEIVQKLCDQSVGAGFYTQDHLRELVRRDGHFFNLLWSDEQQLLGYNYNYLCSHGAASQELKLPKEELVPYTDDAAACVFGICKSMGISADCRQSGFGTRLLSYGVKQLFENGALSLWGTAWKQGTRIPIRDIFDVLGFSYLRDVKNVWYEVEGLQCPVCRQPHCVCDAAIFYKYREDPI